MPEPAEQNRSPTSSYNKKVWLAVSITALLVVLLLIFKALFSLILLALAGILFAIYFHGCADFFKRVFKLSQGWSLAVSIIVNLVLIVTFFWFVGARLQMQVVEMADTIPQTIDNAKAYLQQSSLGRKALDSLESSDTRKTMSVAKQFFSSGFGVLSDLYIVLLLGIFFIANPFIYKKGLVHLLPSGAKEKGAAILDEMHRVLKMWIKGQLFGFLFIAILTGMGLWLIGMPLILTLALIAGLLNFIPNFGPIIALVPAALLGLQQGTTTALLVLGLYTFIQIVQSAVTQPLIQKKMVNIPPALVIFGQVAMGLLGGFWGVLLATPAIVIIMTMVNKLYVENQAEHKYEVKKTT